MLSIPFDNVKYLDIIVNPIPDTSTYRISITIRYEKPIGKLHLYEYSYEKQANLYGVYLDIAELISKYKPVYTTVFSEGVDNYAKW